jgi:hypothetical protein
MDNKEVTAEFFKSPNQFSLHIEEIVKEKRINHMDAVLLYCEKNFVEPQDIAHLINKSLKDKIENNARELNYFPKQATLDV